MKAEEHPLSQKPLMLSLTKFTIGICANCGADASIHQYGSGFCPKNGVEQNGIDRWDWEETTFVNKEWKDAVDRLPELLKAEQELEKKKEDHFNSLVYISNQGLKISELEGTISAFKKEIEEERTGRWKERKEREAILKGLRDADDALSFANEHARAKQIIRDLLKEHKS